MGDEGNEVVVPEADVRRMVRLLGNLVNRPGDLAAKRRALMAGLSKLIDADAWSWIISRAGDDSHNPAVGSYLHGGMTAEQFAKQARVMQDRNNTPIEYAALNELRRRHRRFTRSWDQLVTPEQWYGPRNRAILNELGFEHVLYSVRVLDDDGLFSGIALKRRIGRDNFTPVQRRIVHIIAKEVEWLHHDANLDALTHEIVPLPSRLRTVLTLLIEGFTVQEIADKLDRAYYTINDRTKEIHRHFKVKSRAQLMGRFMVGDGGDVG